MELIKIFENQEKASLWFTEYAKHNNFKRWSYNYLKVYNDKTKNFDKFVELKITH